MEKGWKIGGTQNRGEEEDTRSRCQICRFQTVDNFFSKRNFDTEFEISCVGILDISPYTKSEQARAAEKHLQQDMQKTTKLDVRISLQWTYKI